MTFRSDVQLTLDGREEPLPVPVAAVEPPARLFAWEESRVPGTLPLDSEWTAPRVAGTPRSI